MRIAVVQMNCLVGDAGANIRRMDDFLGQAARDGVQIVCFPELSVSGYNTATHDGKPHAGDRLPCAEPVPGPSTKALEELGRRHGVTFLAGLLEEDRSGIVYNTQLVIGPQGMSGTYRKTHVPTAEIGTFCHGDSAPVFQHERARFGIEICYDTHFPEVSTHLAGRGAEVLFFPHASGGSSGGGRPGETRDDKLARWLRYIPARAYDNTVFVAICNQVGENGTGRDFAGVSFICDPVGRVIAQSSRGDTEELVVADLRASDLAHARRISESFFRHFRRPELYERWSRSGDK